MWLARLWGIKRLSYTHCEVQPGNSTTTCSISPTTVTLKSPGPRYSRQSHYDLHLRFIVGDLLDLAEDGVAPIQATAVVSKMPCTACQGIESCIQYSIDFIAGGGHVCSIEHYDG